MTQGRPGVRVRNDRGKSRPKSLCLCCFFFPELLSFYQEKEKAHRHKYFWPVTVRGGGESPGRVSRGQRSMCCLRNPGNIDLLSGYPTGKTGDRGDRTKFNVPTFFMCLFCYLSNSKAFQDGNGNGNFGEINSNDFQDGNWESMGMKG